MTQTLIMVGFLPTLIPVIDELLPDVDLLIVEDPALAEREAIQKVIAGAPRRRLSLWSYPSATADAWYHRNRDLDVVAVIPCVEYALAFAARLAERFGVPGATLGAAHLMRDKALLREVTAAAGVNNPRFMVVSAFSDVLAFAQANPGPLVLKPSNRQASVGTRIVGDIADLESAWQAVHEQDEAAFVAYRALPVRLQIETFVSGDEFSVEILVRDGSPLFANVTGKLLYPGPRPIEFGHIVPADIAEPTRQRLIDDTLRVLDIIGFNTGVVHCEWIVDGGEPYLVECTGRLPGDGIVHLIAHAWPIDLLHRYVLTMLGRDSDLAPAVARLGATALYPKVEAGLVTAVDGLTEAAATPGVYICSCTVKPGDRVNELRSSWDRVLGIAACAQTPAEALAAAHDAAAKVTITVAPD